MDGFSRDARQIWKTLRSWRYVLKQLLNLPSPLGIALPNRKLRSCLAGGLDIVMRKGWVFISKHQWLPRMINENMRGFCGGCFKLLGRIAGSVPSWRDVKQPLSSQLFWACCLTSAFMPKRMFRYQAFDEQRFFFSTLRSTGDRSWPSKYFSWVCVPESSWGRTMAVGQPTSLRKSTAVKADTKGTKYAWKEKLIKDTV